MKDKIKLLKALSDETRIRIIQSLLDGEKCACAIVPFVGKAQPTVSLDLKILEEAGVLESKRDGINIWYKIKNKDVVKIMKIIGIEKMEIKTKC